MRKEKTTLNMERRPRSLSQKLSSSIDIALKKKSTVSPIRRRPQHSRVASESFIASSASGIYKGQIVGSPSRKGDDDIPDNLTYLNHDDINRRAIQIFHMDGNSSQVVQQDQSICQRLLRIIHPNDPFRRMWDLATVIWVLLLVFFIPLEIGFVWYEAREAWKIIFVILDFWFAVDIILNFRTGYLNHGTVVMDSKKIASNYLSTWFLVDVLGTIPFELLLSGHVSSRKSLKLVKYFKIPKLLRVSRVMKYVRNHKHVYDFTKVLLVIFTTLHIGACIWVSILDPCDDTRTNYAGMNVCSQDNVFRIYSEALHISATMLLGVSNFHIVAKPELINLDFEGRPEHATKVYLLSTAYMIVGLFVIALLMSEANVYLMGKMQGSAAFQRKTDRVNHEMEYYGVPPELQRQVRAFYDYVWIHQKQYDEKIALLSDAQMSTDLQRKLALHLFKDVISHISFFSEIDDLLLGEICLSLRTRIFLPGDMILFKGDVGKELFIISKGVVEVLRDDLPAAKRRSAPKILLQNGSFFGEIALVMEVRRTCSVQARTVCEVNILQQDAFDAIVRENPHFARRMNELVVARQLDSCLARTQQKGVDFQVSQTDLDLAVEAMERNMMEGLERRNNPSSTTNSTSLSDSSHRSNFHSDQHSSSSSNKVFSPMRVSFENHCSPDDDEGAVDEESLLNKSTRGGGPRTSGASAAETPVVTDVLQDIARRSTRFPDEEYIEKIRRNASPNRPLSELIPESNDISDNADISSDGEIKAPKGREVRQRRGTSYIPKRQESERITNSNNTTAATDEESAERLTGHFTPGRCAIDIAKVRPVILQNNNQTEQRFRRADGDVSSLGARLSQQSRLMEKLLAKVEGLERARKSQNNEGRNES